jgi:hypothetical protein
MNWKNLEQVLFRLYYIRLMHHLPPTYPGMEQGVDRPQAQGGGRCQVCGQAHGQMVGCGEKYHVLYAGDFW